jgi:predicted permease
MIRTLRRALLRNWNRLLGGVLHRNGDGDLAEELDSHIRLLTDEEIRRGIPPDEAHRRAILQFGSVESAKESYRDQRGLPALDVIVQDLRYALRGIRKSPGFATVAILSLAIGIGANTTLFSIINAVLLKPLPYPQPDRLVWVGETRADLPFSSTSPGAVSYENFIDWRKQQTVFESIGAYQPAGGSPGIFLIGNEGVRLEIQRMSADAFGALKVAPVNGRVFNNDEDRRGATPCVVLSYRTWQEHFGGMQVVGQKVDMNSVMHTILGVMPPGFSFPYKGVDAWLPLGSLPAPPRAAHKDHAGGSLGTIARLKPGMTLEQARAEMGAIMAGLEKAYPEANKGWKSRVEPMKDVVVGDADRPLWILFGTVGMVLLIACANVANLLLARASVRQHEIGVRAALGASSGRIVRQLLAESFLLASIGTGLGLLFSNIGLASFLALAGNTIPRSAEIHLDLSVLTFAVFLAALTGIAFGLAPAWISSRRAVQESLQASGGRGGTGERGRLRHGLVVAEVALTLLLLTGAGLLLRSFQHLQSVNQGFSGERVFSFDLTLPGVKYRTAHVQNQFFENLIDKLRTLPGVEEVGITSRFPLEKKNAQLLPYTIDGQVKPPDSPPDAMDIVVASPGYFRAMGIPLLRGRFFTEHDGPDSERVVIIDEEFVRRHWPGEDPVGRHIRLEVRPGRYLNLTVAGVAGRVKLGSLSEQGGFVQAYLPAWQLGGIHAAVVLKSKLAPGALISSIRQHVRSLDAAQPIHNLRTIKEVRDNSLTHERLNLSVLGVFALVALILSIVGLYGVIAYSVAQQRREIGVRTALGAQPIDVLGLVIGQGIRLTAFGIFLGILAAFWATRWLSSLLFGITPLDPVTFSAVSLLLLIVALLACWIPARRAAEIDPVQALREQ